MNCINHPETPVASYCQNCGKALCGQCTRPVGDFMYCEQCLAAKIGVPGAQPGAPFPANAPTYAAGANPALATFLGVIPGVGAMYNGQFVKAMIHVVVFVVLIAMTDQHDFFGFFIAAWVIYQIFDANQTARARRDGLPLPDPFGINELAARLGNQPSASAGFAAPSAPRAAQYPPAAYAPPNPVASPFVGPAGAEPPMPPPTAAGFPPPPYPDLPPAAFADPPRRNEPAGAIALIALGLIFLFGTLHIFRFDWIERGWPLIIIGIGLWLFLKRTRETRRPGVGQ